MDKFIDNGIAVLISPGGVSLKVQVSVLDQDVQCADLVVEDILDMVEEYFENANEPVEEDEEF